MPKRADRWRRKMNRIVREAPEELRPYYQSYVDSLDAAKKVFFHRASLEKELASAVGRGIFLARQHKLRLAIAAVEAEVAEVRARASEAGRILSERVTAYRIRGVPASKRGEAIHLIEEEDRQQRELVDSMALLFMSARGDSDRLLQLQEERDRLSAQIAEECERKLGELAS